MSANVETMMYVREVPWHGLGTMVAEAPTSKEALRLAGLDWKVEGRPVYDADGQEIPGELFAAVAQVLAFVISRRTSGRRGGEHRSPRTGGDLPEVARAARRKRRRTPAPKASGPVLAGR